MRRMTIVALFLSSLISCGKDAVEIPSTQVVILPSAVSSISKTRLVEGETTSSFNWDETVSSHINLYENNVLGTNPSSIISSDKKTAQFSAYFKGTSASYCYSALINGRRTTAGNATIPSIQYPLSDSFDPDADVLVGKTTSSFSSRQSQVSMQFGRAAAVSKIRFSNFKESGECVQEVSLTASVCIAGYVKPDYENCKAEYLRGGATKTITLLYNDGLALQNGYFDAYFMTFPVNTGSFTVKVTTDKYIYTKTISGGSISFSLEKLVRSNFTLADASVETAVKTYTRLTDIKDLTEGAEVLIATVYEDSKSNFAISSTQNANNRGKQAVTITDGKISATEGAEIFKVESGTLDGTYSFYATKSATKGYICAASSSSNLLRTQTEKNENASFSVSITSAGVATIKSQGSYTRNLLKYNSTSNLFSCYASGQNDVGIYLCTTGGGPLPPTPPEPVKTWSYLTSYEIPGHTAIASSLTQVNESYGTTKAHVYSTSNSMQKFVTHTFAYGSKVLRNMSMLVDGEKKCALWVAYAANTGEFPDKNVGRNDGWGCDPAVPSSWQMSGGYKESSTYDRGHQVASNDRQTTVAQNKQTFYYTNMTPQYNKLNQGAWNNLESKVQTLANATSGLDTLYVVTGPVFNSTVRTTLDKSGAAVALPDGYFKCLLKCTFDASGNMTSAKGCAFLFEGNDANFTQTTTTIDAVETRTGLDFFANVPDTIETDAESKIGLSW